MKNIHEGSSINPEAQFPLRNWFNQMEEEYRNVIENEIFNTSGTVDLDTLLNGVGDNEIARGIMIRFRNYLDLKRHGASKEVLELEAKEVAQYADKIIVQE